MKRASQMLLILTMLFCLVFLTIAVHELAHIVTAAALGIPLVAFDWFDPRTISPAITFGPTDNRTGMTVVHYAGGFVAGISWLVVSAYLFIFRKYAAKSSLWWCLGLFITTLAFWQIGRGILEGRLHHAYIVGAGKVGSLSFMIECLFIFLGIAVYLRLTRLWRSSLRRKSKA